MCINFVALANAFTSAFSARTSSTGFVEPPDLLGGLLSCRFGPNHSKHLKHLTDFSPLYIFEISFHF